jgi:hypothetical protein
VGGIESVINFKGQKMGKPKEVSPNDMRYKRNRPGGVMKVYPNAGRPIEGYTDDEAEQIGKHMLEWFIANPEACFIQDYIILDEKNKPFDLTLKEIYYLGNFRKVFSKYYDKVKHICGTRMNRGAGKETGIHASIVNRFVGCYFPEVFDKEMEMRRAEKAADQKVDSVVVLVHPDRVNGSDNDQK